MTHTITLLFFSASSVVAGWPASGPELCSVPPGVPVRPSTTCADVNSPLASVESASVDLVAQGGETEDAQLLLRKEADLNDGVGGLRNVTVAVSALPHFIITQVFQVGYVFTKRTSRYEGSGGGWRPDPLIPASSFDVPSDTSQPIWLSFAVSREAQAGVYNASISISCAEGKCRGLRVPVKLQVSQVTLPSLEHSSIGTAWSGRWASQWFEPYYGTNYWNDSGHQWYDLMMLHRTPPDSLYLSTPRSVEEYEYLASKGMSNFGLLDVTKVQNFSHDLHDCHDVSDQEVQNIIDILRHVVTPLQEKGLLDRAYVYGFDEFPTTCEPQIRKIYGAVKRTFPNLRTVATLNWSPMPVDLPVDVWVIDYNSFNVEDTAAWVAAGKKQWHYHCIEPHSLQYLNTFIERPAIQGRLLLWQAALHQQMYGAPSGWLYYAMNRWEPCDSDACGGAVVPAVMQQLPQGDWFHTAYTDFPPANFIWKPDIDDIFANGDGYFTYPCPGGPCGTVRLSSLRDGLEDWELFKKLGRAAVPLIQGLVKSSSDWHADARSMEVARRKAFELLSQTQIV